MNVTISTIAAGARSRQAKTTSASSPQDSVRQPERRTYTPGGGASSRSPDSCSTHYLHRDRRPTCAGRLSCPDALNA